MIDYISGQMYYQTICPKFMVSLGDENTAAIQAVFIFYFLFGLISLVISKANYKLFAEMFIYHILYMMYF